MFESEEGWSVPNETPCIPLNRASRTVGKLVSFYEIGLLCLDEQQECSVGARIGSFYVSYKEKSSRNLSRRSKCVPETKNGGTAKPT